MNCKHADFVRVDGGRRCSYCPAFFPDFKPGAVFGGLFEQLRAGCTAGGSELALGLELFTRTVIGHAKVVLETGRYRGFSGLAIASGLRLLDAGWQDDPSFHHRPDVDYVARHERVARKLYSVDIAPLQEADALWERTGVSSYIEKLDCSVADVDLTRLPKQIDGAFIDDDHSLEGVTSALAKFEPLVKPGGWIVLHDLFGWYGPNGENGSAVKVAAEQLGERMPRWLPVDSASCSFAVFRKPDPRMGF